MNFFLLVGIYVVATSIVFEKINSAIPNPFIDEIFHIPQVQKYCSGIFDEWDSKITTLPGLYLSSVIVLAPGLVIKGKNVCTVWMLRYLNVLYNAASLVIVYQIFKTLNDEAKSRDKNKNKIDEEGSTLGLSSLVVALFPLLYFYSFLYYTDPSATFMVLAAYYACIADHHLTAALFGLISIIYRQSNVIWVIFMAGTTAAQHLESIAEIKKVSASPDLKDKLLRFAFQLIAALLRYLLYVQNTLDVLVAIWPYLGVMVIFALFVFINGGIVVGDRSSHQSVLNIPQLFYFSLFSLFFASPLLISVDKVKRFLHTVKKKYFYTIFSAFLCLYCIINCTYVHPYLLADNRHYVFYLWRLLLGKKFVRIMLIPVYIYSGWSINDSLRPNSRCTTLWRIVFAVCVAAVLIPQKLLEFRYFIIPFVFFRLHVKQQSFKVIFFELLLHTLVNIFSVVVFLTKTFRWTDIAEPQRIIW